MADVKVSGLPSDTSLDGNHYTILNDPTGPTTKRTLLSTLAAFFFNQLNIPDGSGSPRTRMTEQMFDYVVSTATSGTPPLTWSGDAYASTRLASMTSGTVYINGRRLTISAVVSRTFTASKDTYIDILDNGDGTATIVYTEVANNAASPALAANSMRIGIIVTGASNIASVASINQGQVDKVLPIASSIAYTKTDSLGNLICPRDPNRKILGYRQSLATTGIAASAMTQLTGLSAPVLVPGGRDVEVELVIPRATQTAGSIRTVQGSIWDGVVASGTQIAQQQESHDSANILYNNFHPSALVSPSAGLHTYNGAGATDAGTENFVGGSGAPMILIVKLA